MICVAGDLIKITFQNLVAHCGIKLFLSLAFTRSNINVKMTEFVWNSFIFPVRALPFCYSISMSSLCLLDIVDQVEDKNGSRTKYSLLGHPKGKKQEHVWFPIIVRGVFCSTVKFLLYRELFNLACVVYQNVLLLRLPFSRYLKKFIFPLLCRSHTFSCSFNIYELTDYLRINRLSILYRWGMDWTCEYRGNFKENGKNNLYTSVHF